MVPLRRRSSINGVGSRPGVSEVVAVQIEKQ